MKMKINLDIKELKPFSFSKGNAFKSKTEIKHKYSIKTGGKAVWRVSTRIRHARVLRPARG